MYVRVLVQLAAKVPAQFHFPSFASFNSVKQHAPRYSFCTSVGQDNPSMLSSVCLTASCQFAQVLAKPPCACGAGARWPALLDRSPPPGQGYA